MNERKLEFVDFGNLEPSQFNSYEITAIEDMVGTLKSVGLLTPLTVIGPYPSGKYSIISGERRYTGMKKCIEDPDYDGSFDKVPCYVVHGYDTDQTIQELELEIANLETRDSSDKDKHRFKLVSILKKMAESGKIKEKEIVSIMGKCMRESDRYKRMYVAIFDKGTDSTKQLILDKQLSIAEGAALSQLPGKTQDVVANAIKDGVAKKGLLQVVKETSQEVREAKKALKEIEESKKVDESAATLQTGGNIEGSVELEPPVATPVPQTATPHPVNNFEAQEIKKMVTNYEDSVYLNDDESDEDSYDDLSDPEDEPVNDEKDYREILAIARGEKQRKAIEDYVSDVPDDIILNTISTNVKTGSSVVTAANKDIDRVNKWADSIFKKKTFTENELETFERLREMLD
jgi:partition protein